MSNEKMYYCEDRDAYLSKDYVADKVACEEIKGEDYLFEAKEASASEDIGIDLREVFTERLGDFIEDSISLVEKQQRKIEIAQLRVDAILKDIKYWKKTDKKVLVKDILNEV